MMHTITHPGHAMPIRQFVASCLSNRVVAGGLLAFGAVTASAVAPSVASAQWSTAYEQYYLPGKFNWTFRNTYPAADRLFNAFDYGHAILYERLYNDAHAPVSQLEEEEYGFITRTLLVSPPRLPLEESAIEVNYARMAPEAKMMFDWAHLLHRQIYDVLASETMSQAEKDATIAQLVAYYKTRPDLAFSSVPKSMELMEGQPFSLAFRKRNPKFNGLIWGYHWLQVGLYEPLMIGKSPEERQAGVAAAVTRFRQMLEDAPEHMPRIMPMTAGIAPTFAKRYQEAAIIFDNLHAMHDVVSDILANDVVPHDQKRQAILEAASRYRDATSFPMSVAEWSTMGEMMGIENMGGPAVGILPGWPTPTLARGASMLEAMKGMSGMAGMSHGAKAGSAGTSTPMPGMNMSGMKTTDSSAGAHAGMPGMPGHDSAMTRLHERKMRDPVIRERMMADSAMRRMMPSQAKARSTSRAQGRKASASGRATIKPAPATSRKAIPRKPAKRMPDMDMKDMKGMPGMKP